jgi:LPXTG-motif cell wall-anchored protein
MNKKILSTLLAGSILFSATNVYALGAINDIYYSVGSTSYNASNFESNLNEAVKAKLQTAGLSSKYYSLLDAKTNIADAADPEIWNQYAHSGLSSWNGFGQVPEVITSPEDYKHVIVSDNGQTMTFYGYTKPAYKDFFLHKNSPAGKKTLTFDLDLSNAKYHSMEGGGFIFNSKVENNRLYGYVVLYIQGGYVQMYKLNGVDVNSLRDSISEELGSFGSSGITAVGGQVSVGTGSQHSVKLVADATSVSLWDNGTKVIDNQVLDNLNANDFGPFVSYRSHGCQIISVFKFGNLKMLMADGDKSVLKSVEDITWDNDMRTMLIVTDDPAVDLTDKLADELNADNIKLIVIGKSDQETAINNFIENKIGGNGTFLKNDDESDEVELASEEISAPLISQKDDILAVEDAESKLSIQGYSRIDGGYYTNGNLTLVNGSSTSVTWESSDPTVMSNTGEVLKREFRTVDNPNPKTLQVILTATIKSGSITTKKQYTIYIQPGIGQSAAAAPTAPVQDDDNNTFNWTNVSGFASPSDYEYSLDNGTTWVTANKKPIDLSNNNYAVGIVKVRVKADASVGRPVGAALSSTAAYTKAAFTPNAPTAPIQDKENYTFGWTFVQGYNNLSDYELSVDNGSTWSDVTANPQKLPEGDYEAGTVKVRVKEDKSDLRNSGNALSSIEAYKVKRFTVVFKDFDDKKLSEQQVKKGTSAVEPTAPTREGYIFTGWDKAINYITENSTVTALYKLAEGKVIQIPPTKTDSSTSEAVTPVSSLVNSKNTILVEGEHATLTIPSAAISLAGLTDANYLKVFQKVVEENTAEKLTDERPSGLDLVSYILDFNVKLFNSKDEIIKDIHNFDNNEKVKISIKLTDDQLKNMNPSEMAMFYYDETQNKWVELGGEFDSNTKEFTYYTSHFTKFAVMGKTVTDNLPKTGSVIDGRILALLGFMLISAGAYMVINRKNNIQKR